VHLVLHIGGKQQCGGGTIPLAVTKHKARQQTDLLHLSEHGSTKGLFHVLDIAKNNVVLFLGDSTYTIFSLLSLF
jgi:hypothetical protein